jgi:acyl-CoA synthetase (NDP forming)
MAGFDEVSVESPASDAVRGERKLAIASPEGARILIQDAVSAGRGSLDEWQSKMLLAAYDIPIPEGVLVFDEAGAAEAAKNLGGPVAMKAVGSAILHKTERGLVILDVTGPSAAREAFRVLWERGADALEAVLVERMMTGNRELLVGLNRDPVFGPVLAFGLGGVMAEVLGDIALAPVPLSERDVTQLPDLIRARGALGPFRGSPPVDRDTLSRILGALSRIALDFPEVAEIDVNPLLVVGDQPIAADALVVLAPARCEPGPLEQSQEALVGLTSKSPALDLRAVLAPSSVAIVGASDDLGKWGGSALRNLLDGGFDGTIYPVNARGGTFFGLNVYRSLAELPEAPDLALMAVGGQQVKGLLEECGRQGARAAVVLAAGFSETGDEGAALERELLDVAVRYGITLVGPNCMGLLSNERSFHATGFVALHPPKGRLSFVSQSGSLGPGVVHTCERRGIGVDKFISVGNEAQVSAFDVLDYLRDDPHTDGIMMYLEGIEDGRHFLTSAQLTTPRKPVIVLRGGLTESGGKAAASHTGALAGSAAAYRAVARQAGVVTCRDVDELVDVGACLTYLPLPRSRRVAVLTNGGGPGVLAADELALNGLELPAVPADLVSALDRLLPAFWSKRNPLDLVAAGLGDIAMRAIELVARCESFDAVLVLNILGVPYTAAGSRERMPNGEFEGYSPWELSVLSRVSKLMEETGKPIINVPDRPIHAVAAPSASLYVPVVLSSPRAAARALGAMIQLAEFRRWYESRRRAGDSEVTTIIVASRRQNGFREGSDEGGRR